MRYSTYPVFSALSQNPRTRPVVRPLLARYTGRRGLREFDDMVVDLSRVGKGRHEAEQISLAVVSGRRDDQVLAGLGAPFAGFWGDFFKDPKRVAAAVATGGASEAVRGVSKTAYNKLADAFSKGWDSFTDQVKDVLRSFKDINSIRDALNIVKVAASGGISLMADAGFEALNDMIYDLLGPYLRRMGQAVGQTYVKGREAVKDAVRRAMDDTNKTVRKIAVYVVEALYDLALGYPPCVLEEGCIAPVSKGLSNSGVPYVKIVGEVLKVIYPIVQGTAYKSPETSQALFAYAGTKGSPGAQLLPSAKLPGNFAKTLQNVLEAFDEDYAMGFPQSFERYKPWLVDMVARGYRGPEVLTGRHDARWYFDRPKQAHAVLKKANKLSNMLEWADKYLGYLERAWAIGKRAYDVYEAVDLEDLSFDPKEWESEDLGDYLNKKATEIKEWAGQWGDYAKDYAKTAAEDFVESKRNQLRKELFQAQQVATSLKTRAESIASSFGDAEDQELSEESVLDFAKQGRSALRLAFKAGNLGAVDVATATLVEWQPALLGLLARAKWNEMALEWMKLEPKQRESWKRNPQAVWKRKATNYGAWFKEFDTPKMRRMEVAFKAYDLGFQAAAGSYLSSVWRGVQSADVFKRVVDTQGHRVGLRNMHQAVLAMSTAIKIATKQAQIAARVVMGMRNLQLDKPAAKSVVPMPILEAEKRAGLDRKSAWTGPLVALGAAGAAATVAVAVTRR